MATREDALRIAAGEIGYCRYDDPEAGSRYGRWYSRLVGDEGFVPAPFCAMGVSWTLDRAGVRCPGLPGAYCPSIDAIARAAGATEPPSAAMPGDLLLFDWDGDGEADHIGMCEINAGPYLQTIEFNTVIAGRPGSVGRRTRAWDTVMRVVRPAYDEGNGTSPNFLEVDGWWGRDTTRALQEYFGTPVDGEVWHQWPGCRQAACTSGWAYDRSLDGSPVIREFQKLLGMSPDGILGPGTIRAMQARYGTPVDGRLDGPSRGVMALQNALNAGRL